MKSANYKLSIFGENYCVISDESQANVTKAASTVDTLMKEISSKVSHVDEKRVAVLAALQVASRLLALESEIEHINLCQKELVERFDREILALLQR